MFFAVSPLEAGSLYPTTYVPAQVFTIDGKVSSAFGSLLSSKRLGKRCALPLQERAGMPAPARPPQVAQLQPQQAHHIAHRSPAPLARTFITAGT